MPKRRPPPTEIPASERQRATYNLPRTLVDRLAYWTGVRAARRDPGYRGKFTATDLVTEILDRELPPIPDLPSTE